MVQLVPPPRRRSPLVSALFAAMSLMVVAHTLRLLGATGDALDGTMGDALYLGTEATATVLCAIRARTVSRDRRAWTLITFFLLLWTVGDLGWTLHFDAVEDPPFPNWTDAVYLASYAFAYAGLGLLLSSRVRGSQRAPWLDGLVVGLALGAVCAAALVGPIIDRTEGSLAVVATTLAYPVL